MAGHDGEIVVTYASLKDTADQIKAAAGVIEREIETMSSAVGKVGAGWHGEAHQAMLHAQDQLKKRAESIRHVLEKVSALVLTGSEQYHATDRRASRLFTEGY
ncbi:WXG100 family type VII secretion target [Streptomyces sp. NPDC049577]|uniref:WXG100 family type VII secretion target n=1 Tax=Streptomyces sp. NPDC049577 TaxID=3155153 RepID=UPI00342592DD